MPLDPIAKAIIDQMTAVPMPPLSTLSAAAYRAMMGMVPRPPSTIQLAEIVNQTFPGPAGPVKLRIYRPRLDKNQPGLVFFHGGGFVICDLDSHDALCRALAKRVDCTVLSIDYRLAPEHKFPAAVDDAFAAVTWAAKNAESLGLDAKHLAVAGDSAGGNLAAVAAILARDRGGPKLCHQLLLYPVMDLTCTTDSYSLFAKDYFLTREMMEWFRMHYLPSGQSPADPMVSPVYAKNFANLPPATIVTAEYDPLRDEGEAYANRLKEAGVPVEVKRYDGVFHGFTSMGGVLPQADESLAWSVGRLRKAFGT